MKNQFNKGDIIIHEPPYDKDDWTFEVINKEKCEYILKSIKGTKVDNIPVVLEDDYILHSKYMKKKQFDKEMKEIIDETI